MMAIRATLRCNLLLNISKNTLKSVGLLQNTNVCLSNILLASRRMSVVLMQKTTASKCLLMSKRAYAMTPAEDHVDVKNLERVYYGSLTPRIRAVKVFSLSTSLAGIAAQPILMEQGMKIGGTGMAVFLCTFAGFFTFVTPFLLHFITKKYVTEIHYNAAADEYVATTINIILFKVLTKFRPIDVKVPEVPGMFTSFNVGQKSLFVDPVMFEDPEHYVRIMGYDKPIDFKLNLKESYNPATKESNKSRKLVK